SGNATGPGLTVIESGATALIHGANYKLDEYRSLVNNGTLTWADSGDVYLGAGMTLTNHGSFLITNARSVYDWYGVQSTIQNYGLIEKSGSAGTATIGSGIMFNNHGTVLVDVGVLSLNGDGTSDGVF